jgi:nitroreductase
MDFNEVIRKRKMIGEYDSKQVSDEIIRKQIRNADSAPSAGHTQVQEFIIVKDRDQEKIKLATMGTPPQTCNRIHQFFLGSAASRIPSRKLTYLEIDHIVHSRCH